jgi:predicted N-acetyltransferase YhbS
MSITRSPYNFTNDFLPVGEFLIGHHRDGNVDGNWLQPAWEYMHHHPLIDEAHLDRCAVWRDDGRIVGVVHYEWFLGEVFFQAAPGHLALKHEMLDYAQEYMRGIDTEHREHVKVFATDLHDDFYAELTRPGYVRAKNEDRPMSRIDLSVPLEYTLPSGFHVQSLADENDLNRIDRCLWRGFNHEGEPDGDLSGRKKMQSGPNFRHDLTAVAVEPGGEYVSLCGTWFESTNRFAYVEPLATDPDFRRMGLARAVVYEGLSRCAREGATIGYVGSIQPFYRAIGFTPIHVEQCWIKRW